MSLPSKREFLSLHINPATSKPFAVFPGRGKFSTEANAFAAANSTKWAEAEQVVKAPKPAPAPKVQPVVTPSVSTHPAAAAASFNAKEVRSWAKANGHAVGERGKIKPEVIDAFAKAGGKAVGPKAPRPTPLLMPKVRRESTGFTVLGGTLIRQDRCGNGPHTVAQCTCPGGPQAYKWLAKENGGPLALTLDKPAL